ncbi:MAG: S-methyl-5-thioribose-1-phosphate isomerase [Sphaerobacter sp.]|nr:S-methyl-5-thioribose-1-phosphate isomerase [Sphaerobacter sp.]
MSHPAALQPLVWDQRVLSLLDQTDLPQRERWVQADTVEAVVHAIRTMQVRGAPAIGIAAAAGMAIAARAASERGEAIGPALDRAAHLLRGTRPTAVNLRWAVERALHEAATAPEPAEVAGALGRLVTRLIDEQWAADRALSALGAALLPDQARVWTHCNTGALATGAYGTALGIIRAAHERGRIAMVYVDESRPRLQGARLTVWELTRLGVPHTLVPDVAAAALMASGRLDAVVVGADRVAANGDVANKIGTYALALAARHHGIPFYVAAPCSTIDLRTPTGGAIPIEERGPDEVRVIGQEAITVPDVAVWNPAFDMSRPPSW